MSDLLNPIGLGALLLAALVFVVGLRVVTGCLKQLVLLAILGALVVAVFVFLSSRGAVPPVLILGLQPL